MNDKDARASWFTFWSFVFATVFCWALIHGWVVIDPRWLALAWGAIVGQIMLLDRKRKHDELCQPSLGIMLEEKKPPQPQEVVAYRAQIQSENGQRIRYAKFALTKAQWAALARVIAAADGKVIRDVVARANVFTNLTSKWPGISSEFERLGWAEDNTLTDAGREWFYQFITPPTPSN